MVYNSGICEVLEHDACYWQTPGGGGFFPQLAIEIKIWESAADREVLSVKWTNECKKKGGKSTSCERYRRWVSPDRTGREREMFLGMSWVCKGSQIPTFLEENLQKTFPLMVSNQLGNGWAIPALHTESRYWGTDKW